MTTIKHLTIIVFSVLLGLGFIAAERRYVTFTPNKSALAPHIDNFEISQSFDLGHNRIILFGTKTTPNRGIGLMLYDSKLKQTIFQDISTGDEDFIKPYFFKTNLASDSIIILCTIGTEYTYGVTVYLFHTNSVKKIGYMDIALNENPYTSSTDPSPWTLIKINDATINFTFSKPISTDFQGQKQNDYKAGELTYQYKNGHLIIQTK